MTSTANLQNNNLKIASFLFQNVLSIAALLHILDNVAKDLHNSITDFDKCMTYTLAICSLLCNEGTRQAIYPSRGEGGGADLTTLLIYLNRPSLFTPSTGGCR